LDRKGKKITETVFFGAPRNSKNLQTLANQLRISKMFWWLNKIFDFCHSLWKTGLRSRR